MQLSLTAVTALFPLFMSLMSFEKAEADKASERMVLLHFGRILRKAKFWSPTLKTVQSVVNDLDEAIVLSGVLRERSLSLQREVGQKSSFQNSMFMPIFMYSLISK